MAACKPSDVSFLTVGGHAGPPLQTNMEEVMVGFQTIDPNKIDGNVFEQIGEQWMLITAGDRKRVNTMTASWGGLGVLWSRNVANVYIRPQRYTYEFVEQSDYFTLSFFGPEHKKDLAFCGANSGRDADKFAACGLTVEYGEQGAPYLAEAELVLVCKKLYSDDIKPERFIDTSIIERHYKGDYHRMYIGEIVAALKKE